jgi:hypothetical protein
LWISSPMKLIAGRETTAPPRIMLRTGSEGSAPAFPSSARYATSRSANCTVVSTSVEAATSAVTTAVPRSG